MSEEKLSVYCLKYAQSQMRESMMFWGGSTEKWRPIAFVVYLIRTGEKNILVDAGCDTISGFVMDWHDSPPSVLKQVGLYAEDITDVVITHAHNDHIGAVKYYENATIHISEGAYERGRKYIPGHFKVSTFEDVLMLHPRIRVLRWGGHAKGSSIVEIQTADKIYVLAGDECYTNLNLEKRLCTGEFVDPEQAMAFVEIYSAEKYCVHTCHDFSLETGRIL